MSDTREMVALPLRRRTLWWCVTLLLVAQGVASTALKDRPLLNVTSPYLDIPEKADLRLSCRGSGPIRWHIPAEWHEERAKRAKVENFQSLRKDHLSDMVLKDLSYKDTGPYSCSYKGKYGDAASTVYIFVNDPEHLFLPDPEGERYRYVVLQEDKPAVLPCLPTNSKVEVTLWRVIGERDKLIPTDDGMTFDPTQGYYVKKPSKDLAGTLKCKAHHRGVSEDVIITVLVLGDTHEEPKPKIEISQAGHIRENTTFTLTCSAEVGMETFLIMEWTYPNKESSRIKEMPAKTDIKDDIQHVTQQLVVTSAKPEDEGTYRCTATDHVGKSHFDETYVTIYGRT